MRKKYMFGDYVANYLYWASGQGTDEMPRHIPKGCKPIAEPKPSTYCHYSNPESQGSFITSTHNFSYYYDPAKEDVSEAYSDRMQSWDYKNFKRACEFVESGDGAWAYKLPGIGDEKLKEFARMILKLPCTPTHVLVVHHFNVATGYSCPTVLAIYPKG